MSIYCPNCGGIAPIPEVYRGSNATCLECKQHFIVDNSSQNTGIGLHRQRSQRAAEKCAAAATFRRGVVKFVLFGIVIPTPFAILVFWLYFNPVILAIIISTIFAIVLLLGISTVLALVLLGSSAASDKSGGKGGLIVWPFVHGYFRKDGTWVRPHLKRKIDLSVPPPSPPPFSLPINLISDFYNGTSDSPLETPVGD